MRANQFIPEGRVKELMYDLKDKAMSDADFEKKYSKTRAEVRAMMRNNSNNSLTESQMFENLKKWFSQKWVRFGPDGKIKGDCARGSSSEGKPKCLPAAKAHALGKKGRASAGARKRREDPNPERSGKAINVATKKKSNESVLAAELDEACWKGYRKDGMKTMFGKRYPNCVKVKKTNEQQGVAEGVEQSLPPMKAELVEVMPPWDFEVAVYNPLTAQKEHYIIRPVDMWEMQMNRLQIMTADVRDLQNGDSFFAELESAPNKHYERVFDAISALFWNDRNLNKKLQEIIKHSRDKQTMHKPLPGVTRSQNAEIPADEYIKGAQAEKDLMARLQQGGKKGMAEGSEIKIPTEDGITMQDIRLMAGEGKLTKKTVLQAIAVIRKQREKQGVAETEQQLAEKCWDTHRQAGMKNKGGRQVPNCVPKESVEEAAQTCSECGGPAFTDLILAEKQDACYNKVKSRYKVWPSAYASGALVQCRKKGAANWGNSKNEGMAEGEKIGNMDADAFDAAMSRLKQLAGAGPMKTVYDPGRRVYRNIPTAVQPPQQPKK